MRFGLIALYVLTGMLALEALSAFFRGRADPARVRKRLKVLAKRVAEVATTDGSILRKGAGLSFRNTDGLARLLYRAGGPLTTRRFMLVSVGLAGLGFLATFILTEDPWRAIPALLLGVIPWLGVRRVAAKRTRAFEEQLPDALELLTRCMRTGHALGAGFQMVGEEFGDPVGTEFGLVAEEIRLGLGIRESLENLMRRVDNGDLPYFTTAVLIQRQTGGNLAELLDKLGTLLRERIQFHGRVRALTAQGRGAATFLALWLPFIVVVVWIVAPGYLKPLIENDWGHAVLASAFGIDALAYFMALRIADVQT